MLKTILFNLSSGIALFGAIVPAISVEERDNTTYEMTKCDSIVMSLDYHSSFHSYSHYTDIYKSFMQDYFGPGHILLDPEKSKEYLIEELSGKDEFLGPLYEPTGYEGNFIRVNLSLIKNGVISMDDFFDIFVKSTQKFEQPDGQVWIREWCMVDSLINSHGFNFIDQDKERAIIEEKLRNGDFVIHHSKEYNDSSRFHYRIISKKLFDAAIMPLLR